MQLLPAALFVRGRILAERQPRRDRKQQANREALIEAAYHLIVRHGPEEVTMLQIAERADLGAGTVYNYFQSKTDIVVAVMNKIYVRLADRINEVARKFGDPVDACVYTVHQIMVMAATSSITSRLMSESVLAAQTVFKLNGPHVIPEMEAAREAGVMNFRDAEATWRMMSHAIIGFGIEVRKNKISIDDLNDCVASLLGIFGMRYEIAKKYADKNWPDIPDE
jgi:AcrR family transcriptional regulator